MCFQEVVRDKNAGRQARAGEQHGWKARARLLAPAPFCVLRFGTSTGEKLCLPSAGRTGKRSACSQMPPGSRSGRSCFSRAAPDAGAQVRTTTVLPECFRCQFVPPTAPLQHWYYHHRLVERNEPKGDVWNLAQPVLSAHGGMSINLNPNIQVFITHLVQ